MPVTQYTPLCQWLSIYHYASDAVYTITPVRDAVYTIMPVTQYTPLPDFTDDRNITLSINKESIEIVEPG